MVLLNTPFSEDSIESLTNGKKAYEMSLLFYPILVFEGQWLVSLSMVVSAADTSVITLPILTPCHVYPFLHHHHH